MSSVRNEITKQLNQFGYSRLPEFERINAQDFDSLTFHATLDFLLAVQQVHSNRRDRSVEKKDSISLSLQQAGLYEDLKGRNHNEELSAIVRNSYSTTKIIETDDGLVRKFEPIYSNRNPSYFLDYRAPFYAPDKHLAGFYCSTLSFNLMVLWFMVIVMYFTLYFNLPERLIKSSGRLINWG